MRTRARLALIVLIAFALRALIPVGFMPAADGTASLMICPGGFPLGLLPQEKPSSDGMAMGMPMPQPHHGRGIMEDGFCVFTTGFSFAPPPLMPAVLLLLLAAIAAIKISVAAAAGIRLVYLPQARAPPP
jgi:hypothetical protein